MKASKKVDLLKGKVTIQKAIEEKFLNFKDILD
jgi:hypothetical protein